MKRRSFLKAVLGAVAFIASAAGGLRATVADICCKVKPRPRTLRLPPVPKWNQLTDDIDSADFRSRSQDYERSLLPSDLVFPRTGQVWETVCDCEVPVLVLARTNRWCPVPGPKARLRKGERVRILTLDHPKPLQVRFQPVGNQEFNASTAPDGVRNELWMRMARTIPASRDETGYFNELFRLVEESTISRTEEG